MNKQEVILDDEFTSNKLKGIIAPVIALIRIFVILLFFVWAYLTFDRLKELLTSHNGTQFIGVIFGMLLMLYLFGTPVVYNFNQSIQEFRRSAKIYDKRIFRVNAVIYSSFVFCLYR